MENLERETSGKSMPRRKKNSVRVDFTPLVDLGFLLISFFMLTTSLVRPHTLEVQKPKSSLDPSLITSSQAMTLFLTKGDRIAYYFGMPNTRGIPDQVLFTDFGKNGIREILKRENQKRNPLADSIQIYKNWARTNIISEAEYKRYRSRIESIYSNKALEVLIKAEDQSRYNNLVDILDEMSIANIRSYALVDISPAENHFLNSLIP